MDEQAFRKEIREFAAANFPEEWRFPDHRLSLKQTHEWQLKLNEKGWAAPGWPKKYGGMELSAYEQLVFQEELDNYGVNIGPNMGVTMLGHLLIRYGTEEQKEYYLPKILACEIRWCQGYSEPGAGSDLAGLRTSAVLEGDHFVVNGQKIWTSYAQDADMIFLLVRTNKDCKKQEGISFLLADMKSPGITIKKIKNLTGNSEFCEVFFDNLKVPKENIVGKVNQGWTMAKSLLGAERITIGAPKIARLPLQLVKQLATDNGLWGDPAFRARYTELLLDVDDLDAAFIRFGEVLRRGDELGPEVSMLKVWITEAAQRATDMLVEVGGEASLINDSIELGDGGSVHPANHSFASRPASIYGGTNEIQRNILAKAVLQLPS